MQSRTCITEYLQRERKDPFCFDFNGGIALKMFKEMDFEENSLWSKFGKMVMKGFTRGSLFCEIQVLFSKSVFIKKGFQPIIFEVNSSPCNSEKVPQAFYHIAFVFALLNFFDASANLQLHKKLLSDPNFIIVWSLVKLFPTDNIWKVQRHFLLLHLYLWKLNFRDGPANFNSQLKYSALETFITPKTSIITYEH